MDSLPKFRLYIQFYTHKITEFKNSILVEYKTGFLIRHVREALNFWRDLKIIPVESSYKILNLRHVFPYINFAFISRVKHF